MPEDWKRAPPTSAYVRPGITLEISAEVIAATTQSLKKAGALESCAFWYGRRSSAGDGVVEGVLVPAQTARPGNYFVDAAAMSRMSGMVPDQWRPLAQIHSHPGRFVEHSIYDDRMASSRRALSIVIPSYGHWSGSWPIGIGVHEWQDGYWHFLADHDARERVVVGPGRPLVLKDFRR